MSEAPEELHSHEFTDLWSHWLTREQRRAVSRAVWSAAPLDDGRLEALAAQHAHRQWKFWVLQAVVYFCIAVPAAMRLVGLSGSSLLVDWVLLSVGAVGLVVAIAGVVTHRRAARRRHAAADWAAIRQLAQERRTAHTS